MQCVYEYPDGEMDIFYKRKEAEAYEKKHTDADLMYIYGTMKEINTIGMRMGITKIRYHFPHGIKVIEPSPANANNDHYCPRLDRAIRAFRKTNQYDHLKMLIKYPVIVPVKLDPETECLRYCKLKVKHKDGNIEKKLCVFSNVFEYEKFAAWNESAEKDFIYEPIFITLKQVFRLENENILINPCGNSCVLGKNHIDYLHRMYNRKGKE